MLFPVFLMVMFLLVVPAITPSVCAAAYPLTSPSSRVLFLITRRQIC